MIIFLIIIASIWAGLYAYRYFVFDGLETGGNEQVETEANWTASDIN